MKLMLLSSPFFRIHEEWLLEKSEKDEEYQKKILEKIGGLIKKIDEKRDDSISNYLKQIQNTEGNA
jgi:hypothetical protein